MDKYLDAGREFIDQFPKTKQELLQLQKVSMQGIQQEMMSEMKEEEGDDVVTPPIDDAMAEQMLYVSLVSMYRFLYDFLDSKKIYVNIFYDEENKFGYQIVGGPGNNGYPSRLDAEQAAFKEGIQINEKQ